MWFNKNIRENVSNLEGKYNQFVFKCFDFSPFEVSGLNTYHKAVMWSQEGKVFSTVYKASVGSEIWHIFSLSCSTFLISLAFKLLNSKMTLC